MTKNQSVRLFLPLEPLCLREMTVAMNRENCSTFLDNEFGYVTAKKLDVAYHFHLIIM